MLCLGNAHFCTCMQVEHVLFQDLKGFEMVIPAVPTEDEMVLAAKADVLRSVQANTPGPFQ